MTHNCPECDAECNCADVKEGEDCTHCPRLPWDDEEHPDSEYEPVTDEKVR